MSAGGEARLQALDEVLDQAEARTTSSDQGLLKNLAAVVTGAPREAHMDALPGDLFAVVDALDSSVSLRRAMTDPSTPEEGRRRLVHTLLDGKVSKVAVHIVEEAAALRWGGGRALSDALERQGVRAQLMVAERAGSLDEVEDELFRFARVVEATPEVRDSLSDRAFDIAGRRALVEDLLRGRASDTTVVLARRAVAARQRTFAHTIEGYTELAAAQKNRVVATVRVARHSPSRSAGRCCCRRSSTRTSSAASGSSWATR